jgi:hypothetical protein
MDTTPRGFEATIVARDEAGQERPLMVDEDRGLIIVRDDAMIRVLCPNAALELANAVIQTVIRFRRRRELGPFGSSEDI